MEKKTMLRSLALIRLALEKRNRRQAMMDMFQEEWNAISSFLDDFGEERWNDLDDISKQRKVVEKEIFSLESEIISTLKGLDIQALEDLISKEEIEDEVNLTASPEESQGEPVNNA